MIRKSHAASLLTLALVGGMSLPAMASLPILPFSDVDEAPSALIVGSTASVANVTDLEAAGEAVFDDVYEGWFACDQATTSGTTGPVINALVTSNSTLVGIAFTPPNETGSWDCRSLNATGDSIDLSSATIWDSTNSPSPAFVAYSGKAADFPHIAYFGAYVKKTETPATSNMRLVVPRTIEFVPPSASPTALLPVFTIAGSGALSISISPSWTGHDSSSAGYHVLACNGSISPAVSTPKTNAELGAMNLPTCTILFDPSSDNNDEYPATDLATAKVRDGATFINFDSSVHGQNIAIRSFARYASVSYSVFTATQVYQASPSAQRIQPVLSLSGSTVEIDQQMVWELRTDWARNVLFVCTDDELALVQAASDYFAQCEIVSIGDFGAPLTSFNTTSGSLLSNVSYAAADHGTKFVYLSIYWGSDGINNNPVYFGVSNVLDASAASTPAAETADVVRPAPFAGPLLQAPGALRPVAPGAKLVIPGSNLTGVSMVTIGGKDAAVKVNSDGELELTVPAGLAAGSYDLVITSSSGVVTVQSAIFISGSAVIAESAARTSTKLKEDNTVKVWVFDVAGAGKVQVKLNGKEVVWVNTTDPNHRKLTNGYLVRTLTLSEGKNVIEVLVDSKRVSRNAYTN